MKRALHVNLRVRNLANNVDLTTNVKYVTQDTISLKENVDNAILSVCSAVKCLISVQCVRKVCFLMVILVSYARIIVLNVKQVKNFVYRAMILLI